MTNDELMACVVAAVERGRPGASAALLRDAVVRPADDDLLRFFFELYLENCGISAGERTAAWDMACAAMFPEPYACPDLEEVEIKARALTDWSRAEDYDIASMSAEQSLAIMIELYCEEPGPELARGIGATVASIALRAKRGDVEAALNGEDDEDDGGPSVDLDEIPESQRAGLKFKR